MLLLSLCRIFSLSFSIVDGIVLLLFSPFPWRNYKSSRAPLFKYISFFLFFWGLASVIDPIVLIYGTLKYSSLNAFYPLIQKQTIVSFSLLSLGLYYHITFIEHLLLPHINKKFLGLQKLITLICSSSLFVLFLLSYTNTLVFYFEILYFINSTLFFFYDAEITFQLRANLKGTELPKKVTQQGLCFIGSSAIVSILVNFFFIIHELMKILSSNLVEQCSIFLPMAWGLGFIVFIMIHLGYVYPLRKLEALVKEAKEIDNPIIKRNTLLLIAKILMDVGHTELSENIARELIALNPMEFPTIGSVFNKEMINKEITSPFKLKESLTSANLEIKDLQNFSLITGYKVPPSINNLQPSSFHPVSHESGLKTRSIADVLLQNNIGLLIYGTNGVELFKYGLQPDFDTSLLGGFISALRSFSKEIQEEQLREIIFQNTKFVIYHEKGMLFFLLGIIPAEKKSSEIMPLFSRIYRLFYDKFKKYIHGYLGLYKVFESFSHVLEKEKVNMNLY